MTSVTVAQLSAAAPSGDPAVIKAIADASGVVFPKYGITTRNRALGFLSTALEESGFRTLTENLNYSAKRASQVWPSKFPNPAAAAPYAMNPRALANKVYGGRMGNVGPDDGWRYRGQGLIQITGKDNFTLLSKLTGLPLAEHPEMVAQPAYLLECSVALFVHYPGILDHCDRREWNAVWALVGSGRANGPVINPANHQSALARISAAIPTWTETPASGQVSPPPPIAAPEPKAAPTPVPVTSGWWSKLWAWVKG